MYSRGPQSFESNKDKSDQSRGCELLKWMSSNEVANDQHRPSNPSKN
jgi:hypothetical protein